MKRITHNEYGVNRSVKAVLINRLKKEGNYGAWVRFRGALVNFGVPQNVAWKVAAYPWPPQDGSIAEIVADPAYAEIQANWENGKYPHPPEFEKHSNGITTNFNKFKEPPSPEFEEAAEDVKKAPKRFEAKYKQLAKQVIGRESDELTESRWAFRNYLVDVDEIDVDDIPSTGALGLLMHLQRDQGNFGDFVRTNFSKLLPDKKTVEYEARFKDDGRTLGLVDEFERQLNLEEAEA